MEVSLIAKVTKGILKGSSDNVKIKAFSIDTRKIQKGEVFIALRGSRYDGHSFIEDAFKKGAIGVISERDLSPPKGKFVIKVESTLEALKNLALYKRKSFRGRVIGIAGSAGKTTTKELLAHLLSLKGRVFKTPGNLNSQIGLPYVIANADLNADFWILEIGASKLGEVKELTKISMPDIRVITALGEEHLEGFGSLENVIRGNGELFYNFRKDNYAVIPDYTLEYYTLPRERVLTFGKKGDLRIESLSLSLKGVSVRVEGLEFFLPIINLGIAQNLLASLGVLKVLGFELKEFTERVKNFKGAEGRMELLKFENFYLINDSYNSNPTSLRNAIETLKALNYPKTIIILGDMLELGEKSRELHTEAGFLIKSLNPYYTLLYGKEMFNAYKLLKENAFHTTVWEELVSFIKERREIFKNALIFIKGSRGMRLERLIDVFGGINNEFAR